jgi:multicomponent Na+:H+ antiporter subunit C
VEGLEQFRLFAVAAVSLVAIGLYGVVTAPTLFRRLLSVNVMANGTFMFLVTVARLHDGAEPDPLPHAMVLTGIVVAVSVTAVGVGIVRRIHRLEVEQGTADETGEHG